MSKNLLLHRELKDKCKLIQETVSCVKTSKKTDKSRSKIRLFGTESRKSEFVYFQASFGLGWGRGVVTDISNYYFFTTHENTIPILNFFFIFTASTSFFGNFGVFLAIFTRFTI